MADFSMLDTEFALWSPTFKTQGGNPTTEVPPGATISYASDNPAITPLQFTSPNPESSEPAPDINPNGSEGVYVRSGSTGSAKLTATGGGSIASFPAQSAVVDVRGSEAGKLNMTFGTPKVETDPDNDGTPG